MKTKKLFLLLFISALFSYNLTSQTPMNTSWFTNKNYTSLQIKKFKSISNHELQKSVIITDIKQIKNLTEQIEKIPSNGDEMIKFGADAEQIVLLFTFENKVTEIQLLAKRFKTPSTGFNSVNSPLEKEIYKEVELLLFSNNKK